MKFNLKPSLNWLLVFVPATIVTDIVAPDQETTIFVLACIAIIPLAGWLGKATEHLAERTSEGIGGLLNATFGNAAELIIAIVALNKGLTGIVKASLTGSIIGNLLLVLGLSLFFGGVKHKEQKFNSAGARTLATMCTLAAIAFVLPAAFHNLGGRATLGVEDTLSVEISIVLLVCYILMLVFSLHTHKNLFTGTAAEAAKVEDSGHKPWSVGKSLGVLIGAASLIGWISEILVGAVETAAHTLGMTEVFVGVVVVAIVGNAAEHSTAILVSWKNRMDLSLGIAIGSSIQIALFIAPLLVILSHFISPEPMNLVFTTAEVLAIVVAVIITEQIASDGESNWLEGIQLLAVYIILGIMFYFLPEAASVAH